MADKNINIPEITTDDDIKNIPDYELKMWGVSPEEQEEIDAILKEDFAELFD